MLGLVAVAVMASAVIAESGAIFDTRSVLLSIGSLFLGPIPAIIAGSNGGGLQILARRCGAVPGVFVICTSIAIGLLWRKFLVHRLSEGPVWQFLWFGLIVHAVMLLVLSLLFDAETARQTLPLIWLPVITIYPVVTVILGLIMSEQVRRRQLHEQLHRAIVEAEHQTRLAEQASRAKSAFLANISHEIRTPLNGLLGMLNLMEETKLDTQQKHFNENAKISGETLLNLLNEVLDYSRLEADRLTLESIRFSPRDLLENLAELMTGNAQAKELDFVTNIPWQLPQWLEGDPHRLRQILNNLLSNAVKFTAKGTVTFRVECAYMDSEQSRARLTIDVDDTGIGIPAEKRYLLFEPFSQMDSSNTRLYGGSGLGLAISKRLAEAMRGTLELHNRKGPGSCFRFCLDLPCGPVEQVEIPEAAKRDCEVCVVDSCAGWREVLVSWLQSVGLKCRAFAPDQAWQDYLRTPLLDGLGKRVLMIDGNLEMQPAEPVCKTIRLRYWNQMRIGDLQREDTFENVLMKPLRKKRFLQLLHDCFPMSNTKNSSDKPNRPTFESSRVLMVDDH
ncbi:MAG: ATP-binding protein [Verrucomicrobia bacterium]|nr:ATP-binding protein [Verrucomicrobiota bacterium]